MGGVVCVYKPVFVGATRVARVLRRSGGEGAAGASGKARGLRRSYSRDRARWVSGKARGLRRSYSRDRARWACVGAVGGRWRGGSHMRGGFCRSDASREGFAAVGRRGCCGASGKARGLRRSYSRDQARWVFVGAVGGRWRGGSRMRGGSHMRGGFCRSDASREGFAAVGRRGRCGASGKARGLRRSYSRDQARWVFVGAVGGRWRGGSHMRGGFCRSDASREGFAAVGRRGCCGGEWKSSRLAPLLQPGSSAVGFRKSSRLAPLLQPGSSAVGFRKSSRLAPLLQPGSCAVGMRWRGGWPLAWRLPYARRFL